jgi:hypothetical protein
MKAIRARAESAAADMQERASKAADMATQQAVQAGRDAMERARCEADNAQQIIDAAADSTIAAARAAEQAGIKGVNMAKDTLYDGFTSSEAQLAMYLASRPVPLGPFALYIRLGDLAYKLTTSAPFEFTVYFFITVSCLYAGASTYSELADAAWMSTLDLVLAIIFLTETALKFVAEGTHPWKFFYGNPYWGWNCFDFTSAHPCPSRLALVLTTFCVCVLTTCAWPLCLRLQSTPSRCHGSPTKSRMLYGNSGVSLVS